MATYGAAQESLRFFLVHLRQADELRVPPDGRLDIAEREYADARLGD